MDPKILNDIALNSGLNAGDLTLLNQILGSGGSKNKLPKMSAKDKNNLINKLSTSITLNNIPQKELKDMNEDEKKIYREELRKKLKNKQNEKNMIRTNHLANNNNNNYTDTINKLSTMMNGMNINPQNEQMNEKNKILNLDKFNDLLNDKDNQNQNQNKIINEDLDDYIK